MKNNKKILLCCYFFILLAGICFAGINIVYGENTGTTTILGETIHTDTLNGFVELALAVAKWILGISGSLSLLMFVYGGVMFLISAGSSEKVTKAKEIIIGSVIGLIIVFASYTIIGFVINTMGKEGTSWTTAPKNN